MNPSASIRSIPSFGLLPLADSFFWASSSDRWHISSAEVEQQTIPIMEDWGLGVSPHHPLSFLKFIWSLSCPSLSKHFNFSPAHFIETGNEPALVTLIACVQLLPCSQSSVLTLAIPLQGFPPLPFQANYCYLSQGSALSSPWVYWVEINSSMEAVVVDAGSKFLKAGPAIPDQAPAMVITYSA